MRVKTKTGKFASKSSAIYKFCNRTGLTPEDYYKWATECGEKASNNFKDKKICEKFKLESIDQLSEYHVLDCSDIANENELHNFILDNCNNPADMAASYLEVKRQWQDYEDKNDFIQANLSKFPKKSFERWSDINLISQVSPSWFDSKGIALDVQAEALTEAFYIEITIQDIVDHILNFKKGKYQNPQHQLIEKYKIKLDEVCGFEVTEKYAERLKSIIEKPIVYNEAIPEVIENQDLPF